MTDKEKIADAANNMENKYIKNIPEKLLVSQIFRPIYARS